MSGLKGSVPTGNFAEPRPTSGAFAFLKELREIRARGKPKNPPRRWGPTRPIYCVTSLM